MSKYGNLSLFSNFIEEHNKLSKETSRYQRSLFDRRSREGNLRDAVSNLSHQFLDLYWRKNERDESYEEFVSKRKIVEDDGADFSSEVMGELYSYRNLEDCKSPAKWAKEAHELLNDLDEFQILKEFTRGDADCSALAASTFLKKLADDIANLRDIIQEEEEGCPGDPNPEGPNDGKGDPSPEGPTGRGREEIAKERKKIENSLRYKAGKICEDLTKEVAEVKEALNDIERGEGGGEGTGGWGDAQVDQQYNEKDEKRWKLVEKLARDEHFKKVLKLAGRLKRIGEGLPRKTDNVDEEIIGLELGNDITKILDEDLALMNDKVLSPLFWAEFAEESCVQYKMQGKEPQARGPIVLMLDCSGSMGGQPNELARAVGTAYMMKAKQEKRSCDVLNFNSWVSSHYAVDKNGKAKKAIGYYCEGDLQDSNFLSVVEENLSIRACGGTCFNTVFGYAFDKTNALKEDKGDIIFVTDDGARVSPDVMKRIEAFKDRGGRVFTYLINGGYCSSSLKEISEMVINLDKIGQGDQLEALAEPMRKV